MDWNKNNFKLQYDPSDIPVLEAEYIDQEGDDHEMLDAGKRIENGDYSRANLEIVCGWKSRRRLGLLSENTDAVIKRALVGAVSAKNTKEALESLMALHGVAVKMGSAILTAIAPHRYSVFDYRALEALGVKDNNTVCCYLAYLDACRDLANKHGVTLRGLDRANWQWSKRKSKQLNQCAASTYPRSCSVAHDLWSPGSPQSA